MAGTSDSLEEHSRVHHVLRPADCDSERVSSCGPQAAMERDSDDSTKASLGDSKAGLMVTTEVSNDLDETQHEYRLYKRRFVGQVALFLLCVGSAMPWPWFGPIANDVQAEYGFSLDQINWLGTVTNVVLLPVSLLVPGICSRYGIQRTCEIGAVFLLVSAWVRYAGTANVSSEASYALIILGQIIGGAAQPFFLILGPKYSQTWFDLKGRMTATMVLSVANPVGGALAQLISPIPGNVKTSILVLGIISTVIAPLSLLVGSAPPTPPTFSATHANPGNDSLLRAMLGKEPEDLPTHMTVRERFDFGVMVLIFGLLVGVVTAFSVLTAQVFEPYGYSDTVSGLMGAVLLLVGLVFAIITSPLFDRVLTHHMALVCKILCPILGVLWLSLIWAVKRDNTGGLFAIMAIIGATSLTLLPVALELAVELTRNPDGSAAILWFSGNLFGIIFVLVEGAMRASDSADPPNNLHSALIFQGAFVCALVIFIFFLHGEQKRRRTDEHHAQKAKEAKEQIDLKATSPSIVSP
ncbi:hypothetical protein QCA50_020083 [Cerrena zonata]|uniref:MFS general substrate transporter n=1 Tax=Cerrena zonata TaxID=2478898 RepID=A0AAW0F885_9APHY